MNKLDRSYTSHCALVLIILVAINLRPCLASISPIISQIQHYININNQQIGLLSTVPVTLMGVVSLGSGYIQKKLGTYRGIIIGLFFIALGLAGRFIEGSAGLLIITSFFCGVGIALEQTLIPVFIKLNFNTSRSVIMSIYSTCIMLGATLAAGVSNPLSLWVGWRESLSIWSILAIIALSFCLLFKNKFIIITKDTPSVKSVVINDSYTWLLMCIFGLGTAAYTLVLSWLPSFYVHLGWNENDSGYLLSALTATEVIAGFSVSYLLSKFVDRRPLFYTAILLLTLGFLNIIFLPSWYITTILFLGLSIGALFPLSLVVTADYSRNSSHLAALMGFVQGGGYIIAAIVPYLGGLLQDTIKNPTTIWVLMLFLCPILFIQCTKLKIIS